MTDSQSDTPFNVTKTGKVIQSNNVPNHIDGTLTNIPDNSELDNMIEMLEHELDLMRIGKFEGVGDHKYHRMFLTLAHAIDRLATLKSKEHNHATEN